MQSSPVILFAVICGFFLIIAAMVAFVIVASRKENEAYARVSGAMGFTAPGNTDELMQRITFLRDIQPEPHHRLTHVYCRSHASGAKTCMYNLSFRTRSRSESGSGKKTTYHPLEMNALAFISPDWNLPRFNALPRLAGSGVMAKMGNALTEKVMDIKHEIIKFPHIPNLDERYIISTPDIPPSHVRPSDEFLRVLAAHPNLSLYAGGDMLTLSFANAHSGSPDEEKMKQLYKIGVALARTLG